MLFDRPTASRRLLAVLLLSVTALASFPAAQGVAANRNALWRVVHDLCVTDMKLGGHAAPCSKVDLRTGYAVVPDLQNPAQLLVVPTARLTGVEDPKLLEDLDAHLFQYELSLQARRRPELAREMRSLYEDYYDLTRQALEKVGIADPDEDLVRFVFAAMDGLVIRQIVDGDPDATEAAVAELRRMLAGLGAGDGR